MLDAMNRIARFFDDEFADYADDLPVLEAYAAHRGPILELGCGTGRALIPLARGFNVTGIDLSPAMLARARAKADAAGVAKRITLLEGDYAEAALGGPHRFAFTVMNTFLHLQDQQAQVRALRHWRGHLAPRGLLLIDVLLPDMATFAGLDGRLELVRSWVDLEAGRTVLKFLSRTVDPAAQMLHIHHIYDEIGPEGQVQRTVAPYDLRYLWRFEAELLLEKAGYVLEAIYGGWDMGPLEEDSERMILVSRPKPRSES